MKSFKGTLVLAGACAALGLGCSHNRELPATRNAPPPGTQGTETGTGGAGTYGGGMPSSTPATTTPRGEASELPDDSRRSTTPSTPGSTVPQETGTVTTPASPSTPTTPSVPASPDDQSMNLPEPSDLKPGTGGSGVDVGQPKDMNPEACVRNQIGSPNASDVICEDEVRGTGGSGAEGTLDQGMSVPGETTSTGSSSDTLSTEQGIGGSSDVGTSEHHDHDKQHKKMKKSGTGGSGDDQSAVTSETKETKKAKKKHHDRKVQDDRGTGGSGTETDQDQQKLEEDQAIERDYNQ